MVKYELYHPNSIKVDLIYDYLLEMDKEYIPHISDIVDDMYQYAEKIATNAYVLICFVDNSIAGIYALYINSVYSFMTTGSVKPKYRSRGIFKEFLRRGIKLSKSQGVAFTELEVYVENTKALNSYEKMGYKIYRRKNNKLIMRIDFEME